MSSQTQEKVLEKKIFGEARGRYTLVDGDKAFHFDFPNTSTIEDNFSTISFMKEKLLEAIQNKEKEDQKKEENKADTSHKNTPISSTSE